MTGQEARKILRKGQNWVYTGPTGTRYIHRNLLRLEYPYKFGNGKQLGFDDSYGTYELLTDVNTGEKAAQWLESIAAMLRQKNQSYGNSVGEPVRIFSDCDSIEGLMVRMDDKWSRMMRGTASGEDPNRDFIGYYALAVAEGWEGPDAEMLKRIKDK